MQQPRAPALMQEVDERDLFGSVRVRRSSGGSVDSVDSSMASFWTATPSLSANRLTTIQSDSESMLGNDQESTAGSSFIHGASKEQVLKIF